MQNTLRSEIKKLVSQLLDTSTNEMETANVLNKIHVYFQQHTQITGFDTKIEYLAAIPTAKGKALGLNHAAQCLLDYKRTVKFLEAIILAIKEKQKIAPDECINIFYAGCGPYAPLMSLIAPFFTPEEVQFSILEINKNSLESAKKLINSLGLSTYIQEYYLADAVTVKVADAYTFHIFISETLDALLYRECYVPILWNMLPQFDKNITVIPKNVCIHLSLLPNEKNRAQKEHKIAKTFDVREAILGYKGVSGLPAKFPDKKIDLTSLDMATFDTFVLDTHVHVHNNIRLYRNESSLTLPLEIPISHPFQKKAITFTYHMEYDIELKCRFE